MTFMTSVLLTPVLAVTLTEIELNRLKRLSISGPRTGVSFTNWLKGAICPLLRMNMLLRSLSVVLLCGLLCSMTR